MTGCRPDLPMAGQPGVDQGADGCWMPDRGDTSDRLSGVPPYEIGIGSANPRRGRGPEQGGVGTVRSAGQDEQRHSVGVEDQGVRDGPNIAAELFCSRGRARCRMRKQHHPTRHSCGGEDLCDAADVGVIRAGGGPDAHGGERRRAVGHRTRHVVGDG